MNLLLVVFGIFMLMYLVFFLKGKVIPLLDIETMVLGRILIFSLVIISLVIPDSFAMVTSILSLLLVVIVFWYVEEIKGGENVF